MVNRKQTGPQLIMNSTPISISDSSGVSPLKMTESAEEIALQSIPSSSKIRRPINWTSKKFKQSLLDLKTPSGICRVFDWMGKNVVDTSLPNVDTERQNTESNDTVFCRYDYKLNKAGSLAKNDEMELTQSIFNKSVPLCISPITVTSLKPSSLKDASPNSIRSNSVCSVKCKVRPKSVQNFHESCNGPNGDLYFSPSSAESRKKELCNYLKLMNHADKKVVSLSQYRRSTRVKNLEQKELSKKIRNTEHCEHISHNASEESSDKSSEIFRDTLSNIGESITLQSFNDLNMTVDASKYPTLVENENSKKIFNFVMPPITVLNEFSDFHHWMEPLIKKRHMIGRDQKNNGSINIENSKTHSKSKKESIREELRNKFSESKNINKTNNKFDKFRKKYQNTPRFSEQKSSQSKKLMNVNKDNQKQNDEEKKLSPRLRKTKNSDNIEFPKCSEEFVSNVDNAKEPMGSKCIKNVDELPMAYKISTLDQENYENKVKQKKNGSIVESNENIRIDHEILETIDNSLDDLGFHENEESSNVISQDYNCQGFNEYDVRKSQENESKFEQFLHHLCYLPHENIVSYDPISVEIRECKESSDRGLEILCETYGSSKHSDQEMEEIHSDSDTASDSQSSIESDDSSDSISVSLPEKENSNELSSLKCDIISPSQIAPKISKILEFNENVEVQTLHSLLKKQVKTTPSLGSMNPNQDWDSDNSIYEKHRTETSRNNSHFVSFEKENGAVQSAIYIDFHLVLIQEFAVSLWNQTALGNVLGAQNLWVFNGCTKKLILNKECIRKKSLEMVISTEPCVVYVELWTKEHKSDIRQGPVADVFATVYFWIQKLNKMDKKVLQLENINGFADDVQYVVLKPSLNIVVSWHSVVENNRVTQIRIYTLATDFQTIANARAMEKVGHYVSSLHNIEDCEELLMGCGEHKITLWNIEHGYIVASIELADIKLSLSTLWVKCDRGILFTVQQCVDRELRLIAINGRSHSWKRLKSYMPPEGFERIQNVYIENGVLIAFYEEGILCWKAQTGEQILEETHNETAVEYFPSGKYVIMLTDKNIFIRHALTHLLTVDD